MTLEAMLTRKRVLIGIAVAYWALAFIFAFCMGLHEEGRIVDAMHGLARFYPGDPRLGHVDRAATEEGGEAEMVTLMMAGALFLILVVAWRVWEMLRAEAGERTALRRAQRRAPFEAPFAPDAPMVLPDAIVAEPPIEPAG